MTILRRPIGYQILACLLIRPAVAFLVPTAVPARDDVPINRILTTRLAAAPGAARRRWTEPFSPRPSHHYEPSSSVRLGASRSSESEAAPAPDAADPSIWEQLGRALTSVEVADPADGGDPALGATPTAAWRQYVQVVSTLRVGVPSLLAAAAAKLVYPTVAMAIAGLIHDQGVFDVVANDYSQYIQNVLTTSGLVFSLLIGQTYYFMVRRGARDTTTLGLALDRCIRLFLVLHASLLSLYTTCCL